MTNKRTALLGILSAFGLIVLILDSKTALGGAASGIELCLRTVVPALFPFIFLNGIITKTLSQSFSKLLSPVGKLFGAPSGAEINIVIGLLGGYPVGAQAVYQGYCAGCYRKEDAKRMLSYCNNPGPAFIFGMVGCLFDSILIPWVIWSIIIVCSFITARLQPVYNTRACRPVFPKSSGTLESTIKAMAKICSWVIIFRTYIAILQRWILWVLPPEIITMTMGILELTNGCISLSDYYDPVFRFCGVCAMLSFGGCCVAMQTLSIAGNLVDKTYLFSKLFQMFLSIPLSLVAAIFLFRQTMNPLIILVAILCFCLAILIGLLLYKNNTGNHTKNNI